MRTLITVKSCYAYEYSQTKSLKVSQTKISFKFGYLIIKEHSMLIFIHTTYTYLFKDQLRMYLYDYFQYV